MQVAGVVRQKELVVREVESVHVIQVKGRQVAHITCQWTKEAARCAALSKQGIFPMKLESNVVSYEVVLKEIQTQLRMLRSL